MKTRLAPIVNSHGFSLVEVLVALLLSAVVTTAAFNAYVNQHKNYMVQDDITSIQANARASVDQLNRQIRMAGYQLPHGLPSVVASNSNPDTITVTYRNDGCSTNLNAAMSSTSVDLSCATDPTCFKDGQWSYIWEPDSAKGEWFQVSHAVSGTNKIQHSVGLSRKYGLNSTVLSLIQLKFYVDNSDTTHPKLMVAALNGTPQIFADDITDLQFTYRLTNGSVVNIPASYEDVVEVLVSVSARSSSPDLDRPSGQQYRSRVYTSSVSLRNRGV
jgi:prepilin-type N-terminal cleavage/methylation domain-containing protein